jgi:hypothetical protein
VIKITWLEGSSLAQTVFTNIFYNELLMIQDDEVRIICFSFLKIVELLRTLIVSVGTYEDVIFVNFSFKL